MAMKERDEEPTYPALVAANKKAALNPTTQRPVDKKQVYTILRERCYDDANDPSDTWTHDTRASESALTEGEMAARYTWGKKMKAKNHRPDWLYKKVIWTDICSTILARSKKRNREQTLARKGKKGWGSKKSTLKNKNLKGKKTALKQNSWDSIRVWWAPVLMRGKLHVELLGEDFP